MDLADAHPALKAQDYLLAVVAAGSISTGIYTQSRVSSLQFVTDLTVLAQQIVWHARTQAMQSRVPQDVWNLNKNMGIQHDASNRAATTLWLTHDSAATVALAACIVMPILQASASEAEQDLRTLLLPTRRAAFSTSATAVGWGREVSEPLAGVQSSILAALLGPIDQLRNRIWAPHPYRRDHHIEIHQSVPAWLWPQWTLQFEAPGVELDELRRAISVSLLLVGSRLSVQSACVKLGSAITAHAVKRVLGVLSSQSAWITTVSVLVGLARLLASGVCPIDYQRRRQLFVTDLLTDREWERICHELGTPAEDLTRAYLCRWWLYERITGSPTRRGPATYEGRRFWRMYCELPSTLSSEEVTALDCCGRAFLDAHGMADEPLRWQPPLDAVGDSFRHKKPWEAMI